MKLDATPLTDEEIRDIQKHKAELKTMKERVAEKRKDTFYLPIDEERKKELNELTINKKRLYIKNDMQKVNLEALDD